MSKGQCKKQKLPQVCCNLSIFVFRLVKIILLSTVVPKSEMDEVAKMSLNHRYMARGDGDQSDLSSPSVCFKKNCDSKLSKFLILSTIVISVMLEQK